MCAPIRGRVLTAVAKYGFKPDHLQINSYSIDAHRIRGWDGATFSIAGGVIVRNIAEIECPDKRAKWLEYLLLRSGKYELLSKPIDPRNRRWAAKWNGKMPTAWVDKDCKGWKDVESKQAQPIKQSAKPPSTQKKAPAASTKKPNRLQQTLRRIASILSA
jgi:hypothetical protein